jgi:hypothetical protein
MEKKNPQEHYAQLSETLSAIGREDFVHMNLSYDEAVQEGYRIAALAEKYLPQLSLSDIKSELLDSIYCRAAAFAHCVATMESFIQEGISDMQLWQQKKTQGYAVRTELYETLSYIFRNNPQIQDIVAQIRQGKGDLDLIMDLLSYYNLCQQHRPRLQQGNAPMATIDEALTLHNDLRHLAADLKINPEKINEAKLQCLQAYSYLQQATSEIYQAGRFVFRNEPEIKELFYAEHLKQRAETSQRRDIKEEQEVESKQGAMVGAAVGVN